MKNVLFYIDEGLHYDFKEACSDLGISMSIKVSKLISDWLVSGVDNSRSKEILFTSLNDKIDVLKISKEDVFYLRVTLNKLRKLSE